MKETSYIYFADAIENGDLTIKIGETANFEQRAKLLWYVEKRYITKSYQFDGTKAERLALEAILRAKIERHYPQVVVQSGIDHFVCRNSKIAKAIKNHFDEWVAEAVEMLNTIEA